MARLSLIWLFLLLAGENVTATIPPMARLGTVRKTMATNDLDLPPEFATYYYSQTLDHFNYNPESYITFQQRYILNSMYWGGGNTSSPILVYMGAEVDITMGIPAIGFVTELASHFNALVVYIEHRYYGVSMPFGSEEEAYANASTLGFFSSAQALADYAQIVVELKKNMSVENCPIIAIGGSYGGMLASWFRLKYPHVAYGALASSAPVLYFDDITPQDGYYEVVTNDFRNTSESCYNIIKQSWSEIDEIGSQPNGLLNLSQIFSTCFPLSSAQTLKNDLEQGYMKSAQFDTPGNLVEQVCSAIDDAGVGVGILSRIAAGFNVTNGQQRCNNLYESKTNNNRGRTLQNTRRHLLYENGKVAAQSDSILNGWSWQECTEMVIPMGIDTNDTMFQLQPFNLNSFIQGCEARYGVTPRPHWITTEYGGHDIKSVLGNFASNIIFSNGLRDPYSAGGVLQNISESVVAVYTEKGAHCLDLYTPTENDPDWLVSQRDVEIQIIEGWIEKYASTYTSLKQERMD